MAIRKAENEAILKTKLFRKAESEAIFRVRADASFPIAWMLTQYNGLEDRLRTIKLNGRNKYEHIKRNGKTCHRGIGR